MAQEYIRDWNAFSKEAHDLLRQGHAESVKTGVCELQIQKLPSFDPCTNWQIFHNRKKDTCLLARTIWQSDLDFVKFDPVKKIVYPPVLTPTIEQINAPIECDLLQTLKERLLAIKIPPFHGSELFGLDGTSYQIAIGRTFHWSRFRWWKNGPKEWKDLVELTFETIEKFEEILKNHE